MAGWHFSVDTSEVSELSRAMAAAMGQTNWLTAQAMTKAAAQTKRTLAAQIYPQVKGGPNNWTRGGLISSLATPQDLKVQVGWKFGAGEFSASEFSRGPGGTPAGRYMTVNARGGGRRQKSSEARLAKAGVLRGRNTALIPSEQNTNAQGNLSGAAWRAMTQGVLMGRAAGPTAVPALPPKGYTGRRGRAKRSQYFVMRMINNRPVNRYASGGVDTFIAKRTGRNNRGFTVVMWIAERTSYKRRFKVDEIAMKEFNRTFSVVFEEGVVKEIRRRYRKGVI